MGRQTDIKVRMERTHVLLAMGEPAHRQRLARALREEGYEVTEVANGLQLLERLARSMISLHGPALPGVVVTDADMGGMAGLDVLVGMRRTLTNVALVVFAAPTDHAAQAAAERAGASAVLPTPVGAQTLIRVLRAIRPATAWTSMGDMDVLSPQPSARLE